VLAALEATRKTLAQGASAETTQNGDSTSATLRRDYGPAVDAEDADERDPEERDPDEVERFTPSNADASS
jgi:hypothetical protein